jgi:5-methylcytosine-specific restriction endonuclease McrA
MSGISEHRKEYIKNWKRQNRDKVREHARKHYRKGAEAKKDSIRSEEEKRRERKREYARKWYQQNADKVLKKCAEYRKRNPEKRKTWASYRRELRYRRTTRAEALEAAEEIKRLRRGLIGKCSYCGQEFAQKQLHIDHIEPLSKGGLHIAENLTLACQRCNLSKGASVTKCSPIFMLPPATKRPTKTQKPRETKVLAALQYVMDLSL